MADTEPVSEKLNEGQIWLLGNLQRAELEPGEVLVATLAAEMPASHRKYWLARIQEYFPGQRVLLLPSGMELAVLAPPEPAPAVPEDLADK